MSLNLTKIINGDLITFKIAGKILSQSEVEFMDAEIDSLLDSMDTPPKIILDLSELSHVNSTGLNHFIRYFTKSRNKGGELVLIHIRPNILKLLEITKLISVFTIAEDEAKAKQLLNDL